MKIREFCRSLRKNTMSSIALLLLTAMIIGLSGMIVCQHFPFHWIEMVFHSLFTMSASIALYHIGLSSAVSNYHEKQHKKLDLMAKYYIDQINLVEQYIKIMNDIKDDPKCGYDIEYFRERLYKALEKFVYAHMDRYEKRVKERELEEK